MALYLFKALHIIGFVAWFAGLFYLVRMFVYYREAGEKSEVERSVLQPQFYLMQQRVYKIICNPAMMITWICGLGMIYIYGFDWFKENTWLHVKLTLVLLMTGYHLYCKKYISYLKNGTANLNPFQLRLMNEIPTLFLFAIVIFAVFKNGANSLIVLSSTIGFGFILFVFTKLYKKMRESNQK